MKKINFLLLFVLALFFFACQENEEVTPSQDLQNANLEASESKLPLYSEKNSAKFSWESLPEELRNAQEITLDKIDVGQNASYKYSIGPWGGSGGSAFSMYPLASTDKIYAIGIRSGSYVDAIVVWYIRTNGSLYYYRAGGTGGTYYVNYLSSSEYIRAVGGRSGVYLDRLTIYTNQKSFSYGGNGGSAFYRSVASNEQILGFHGRSGSFIDRIGGWVYTRP